MSSASSSSSASPKEVHKRRLDTKLKFVSRLDTKGNADHPVISCHRIRHPHAIASINPHSHTVCKEYAAEILSNKELAV